MKVKKVDIIESQRGYEEGMRAPIITTPPWDLRLNWEVHTVG